MGFFQSGSGNGEAKRAGGGLVDDPSVMSSGNEDSVSRRLGRTPYEVSSRPAPGNLEGSFLEQFQRWLLESLCGRPVANPWHDSSMSHGASYFDSSQSATPGRSRGGGGGAGTNRLLRTEAIVRESTRHEATRFIIWPGNSFLLLWEQVLMIFASYSVYITPFEFCFFNVPPLGLRITDNVINIFFLADIILTFFVAYLDRKSYVLVSDYRKIAVRYLSGWFVWDLLAVIPWDICYVASGADFNGWQQVFRWMMWVRVLRINRMWEYFRKLQRDIRLSFFVVRIVKLLVVELWVTHLAGCIFYFLALTYPPDEEGLTWIGSLTLGNNSYQDFRSLPLGTVYVTSLYWSVVTMATIGYGDIHPVNPREMIFAMIYITFDLILSAYIVGNVTALVVKGSNTTRFRERMSALVKYMNRNKLPARLRAQMKQHVRLQFETEQVEDEILDDFPLSIRHRVARELYRNVIVSCYLFEGCSSEFIDQIVARAVPEYFFPSEVVILQRDAAQHMFIVASGLLEEQGSYFLASKVAASEQQEDSELVTTTSDSIFAGDAFGEVAVLCNIPQPITVVARELCQVLRIDKETLNSVIAMFIIDGRTIVENLLRRTNEQGSKFAALSSEIRSLIAQQEAELTMTTIYAASRGDVQQLKDLVKAGANPSKADYDGRSPLHLAAAGGYDEVVRYLILEGADVNLRDNFGTTPLLEALRAAHDTTASILMENGGAVSLQEAGTDLCNAVVNGDTGLLKRLLDHGVDPNSADYDLRTPLHIASAEGFLMMAKILVEHGADVMAKDRWGNTALDEARRCGSLPLVRYLDDALARKAGRGKPDPLSAGVHHMVASLVQPDVAAVGQPQGTGSQSKADAAPGGTSHRRASSHDALPADHTSTPPPSQPASARAVPPGGTPPGSPGPQESKSGVARVQGGSAGPGPGVPGGLTRKRVTVYPFPPWSSERRRVGRVMWVPSSAAELLAECNQVFGRADLSHIVGQDGGELDSLDLLLDSDRLYLATDKDLAGSLTAGK